MDTGQEISLNDSPPKVSNTEMFITEKDKEIFILIKHEKSSEAVAQQLTKIESQLFYSVQPSEFYNNAWQDNKEKAPSICSIISRFDRIVKWVATLIFTAEENDLPKYKVISYFIDVMFHLYQFHNFDGVMSIMAALHRDDVQKLETDWEVNNF